MSSSSSSPHSEAAAVSSSSSAVVSQPPQSDDFLFYAEGVVLTSVATFGLVGTLMSIYVLVQPKVQYRAKKWGPRLPDILRQGQAEVLSNSRNNIH